MGINFTGIGGGDGVTEFISKISDKITTQYVLVALTQDNLWKMWPTVWRALVEYLESGLWNFHWIPSLPSHQVIKTR